MVFCNGPANVSGSRGWRWPLLAAALAAALAASGCSDDSGDCGPGQTKCNGTCVNTSSDPANCGTCGNTCDTNAGCGKLPNGRLRRRLPGRKEVVHAGRQPSSAGNSNQIASRDVAVHGYLQLVRLL